MKKKYDPPKAEKVVFDYTESVVACSDWGWCKQNQGENSDVSNPHWECKSPDYHGC